MEGMTTDRTRVVRRVDEVLQSCLPKQQFLLKTYLICSLSLVISLIFITPLLSIYLGIPVSIAVVLIGVAYAIAVIENGTIFEGIASAALVLPYVNAQVPLIDGPISANLVVLLLDVALVPAVLLLLLNHSQTPSVKPLSSAQKTVLASLGTLVLWSFLSAVVGNGPSRVAAFAFVLDQIRFLLLFLLAFLLVRETKIEVVLYATGISVLANLIYAFVEIIRGKTLGLTYLGDKTGQYLSVVGLGPVQVQTGLYAGGVVGNGRHLCGIALLFVPLAVFFLSSDGLKKVLSALVASLGILVFIVANTDAGLLAVVYMVGLSGVYIALRKSRIDVFTLYHRGRTKLREPMVAAGFSFVLLCLLGFVAYCVFVIVQSIRTGSGNLFFISLSNLSIRITQYLAAVQLWIKHPLFGIGGYNFVALSETYLPRPMSIHDTFLSYLAEVGLPGFIACCLAVTVPLGELVRRILPLTDDESAFWFVLFLGLTGYLIYSLLVVMYNHIPTQGSYWLLAGAVMGSSRRF